MFPRRLYSLAAQNHRSPPRRSKAKPPARAGKGPLAAQDPGTARIGQGPRVSPAAQEETNGLTAPSGPSREAPVRGPRGSKAASLQDPKGSKVAMPQGQEASKEASRRGQAASKAALIGQGPKASRGALAGQGLRGPAEARLRKARQKTTKKQSRPRTTSARNGPGASRQTRPRRTKRTQTAKKTARVWTAGIPAPEGRRRSSCQSRSCPLSSRLWWRRK